MATMAPVLVSMALYTAPKAPLPSRSNKLYQAQGVSARIMDETGGDNVHIQEFPAAP
jgi:hypothetical protein